MVTTENAAIIRLEGYGLHFSSQALLVVLDVGDPVEALRLRVARFCVIAKGPVFARTPRADAALDLPGRPRSVRRRHAVPGGYPV